MYILQRAVRKMHQSLPVNDAFGKLLPGLKFLLIFVSCHANKQTKQNKKKKKHKINLEILLWSWRFILFSSKYASPVSSPPR